MKFGTELRYRKHDDPDGQRVFILLARADDFGGKIKPNRVLVVQCPPDDDVWEVGSIVYAGPQELVPLDSRE